MALLPPYETTVYLRTELLERDRWRCKYCGDLVTPDPTTLNHVSCLMCNSIKSGRTYEPAAPQILAAVQGGRVRS